jgi:hypothetical protein
LCKNNQELKAPSLTCCTCKAAGCNAPWVFWILPAGTATKAVTSTLPALSNFQVDELEWLKLRALLFQRSIVTMSPKVLCTMIKAHAFGFS